MRRDQQNRLEVSENPVTHHTEALRNDRLLTGIGGWMIVVQAILWVSLLGTMMHFIVELLPLQSGEKWIWLTSPESNAYDPMWATVISFEVYGNLLLFALLLVSLILLYKKKRLFVPFVICYFILVAVVAVVGLGLVQSISVMAEYRTGQSVSKVLQNIGSCVICVSYFLKSRRVKNTFIN